MAGERWVAAWGPEGETDLDTFLRLIRRVGIRYSLDRGEPGRTERWRVALILEREVVWDFTAEGAILEVKVVG